MSATHISELLNRQSTSVADLFGGATYEIVDDQPYSCTVRTDWVEVELCYDRRDKWVSARLKPLLAGPDISFGYSDHLWLKFCGIELATPRKSELDDQQVVDALNLVRPVVSLFKDPRVARDALFFVKGYCHAYTDSVSGN